MTRDHASIAKLPDEPGVYLFLDKRKSVLYVGKATSLRDRVRSYFAADLAATRGAHMVRMVDEAVRVDFETTDSVLEALILEARLIKSLHPPYNTRDKDDKSWNYLIITTHEPWPRLLTVRGKELAAKLSELGGAPLTINDKGSTIPTYGPFIQATQFKEALKLIRAIFPYYDCTQPVEDLRARNDRKLRFNETIGVYPHTGTTKEAYARTIRHIRLFFEGKKQQVLRALEREMRAHARAQEFEEAARTKRMLFALRHINDISLIRRDAGEGSANPPIRVEGYDVAHLQGGAMVGVMTVVEGGEVLRAEYRTFNIHSVQGANDTAALAEVLSRRLAHPEWHYPRLIVVDGSMAQLNAARRVLTDAGVEIPVVAVTKDERHRPKQVRGPVAWRRNYVRDILLANAEAHRFSISTHRKKMRRGAIIKSKTPRPK